MSFTIAAIDPGSERDLADTAALWTAYWREAVDPEDPPTTPNQVRDSLRTDRADIDHRVLLARTDDGTAVGYAAIDIRVGHGNEHMAWVEDIFVTEAHRRQGIGRALAEEVIAIARAAGRTLIESGYQQGHVAGEAFSAALGATTANVDRQNRCRVADLDRSMLEQWVADAAVHAPGYSIVRFDDVCPDDLLDEVVKIASTMNDAPRPDALEDTTYTAEFHREAEAERAKSGIRYWYVAVRHDATGEIAGYTEMQLHPDQPWLVEQGDTAVAPAHRGHGLGRWLKAVNALRVLDELPEARVIETWNDGSNKWMLAINDAMGFRVAATWVQSELTL